MSASHNPPDDNGGKFYDERGAQPVPPDDQIMSDLVDQVTAIKHVAWADAVRSGKVHFLDEAPHQAYIDLCRKQSLVPPPKLDEIRVVFTPLHGGGGFCAGEVLEAQGFRPIPVPEQATPDGQFPNVTKTPNPEVPECMDRAEAVAREHSADLVLATDPDADRIGGLACTSPDGKGDYRFLTGNETRGAADALQAESTRARRVAARVADRHHDGGDDGPDHADRPALRRTGRERSARRLQVPRRCARAARSDRQYEDVRGTPADFVIATEESHGILATPEIRDKDAALRRAAARRGRAARRSGSGRTLVDYLDRPEPPVRLLPQRVAEHRDDRPRRQGEHGPDARRAAQVAAEGDRRAAGDGFEDLRDEDGRMGPFKGETDKAARNFLIFRLGGPGKLSAKVCLRPSGTEPKAKAYIEVAGDPMKPGTPAAAWAADCAAVDVCVQQIATNFLKLAMATVGQTPMPGADKLSR